VSAAGPPLAHRVAAELAPDPARVVARLFLPGEELHQKRSRTSQIVDRVMELPEDEVEELVTRLRADFSSRHRDYERMLEQHASIVVAHVGAELAVTPARTLLLGASFTAEYATEGAALCNPSAVQHPDSGDLAPGRTRRPTSGPSCPTTVTPTSWVRPCCTRCRPGSTAMTSSRCSPPCIRIC
jgi:hypothetical protein